jgi:hypothetical protein
VKAKTVVMVLLLRLLVHQSLGLVEVVVHRIILTKQIKEMAVLAVAEMEQLQ